MNQETINLEIVMTTWNRFPERFHYFQLAVEALKIHLDVTGLNLNWLISVESQNHLLKQEFEDYCDARKIKYIYKPGKPNLGGNLNYLFENSTGDFLLFVQDDFILTRPLEIYQDVEFLLHNQDFGILRYFAGQHENTKFDLGFTLYREDIKALDKSTHYYYCDGPQLRQAWYHKTMGPYSEALAPNGQDHSLGEWDMNMRAKRLEAPSIALRLPGNWFGHAGLISTLKEKWESSSV